MELYLAPTSETMRSLYEQSRDRYMEKPYKERDAGMDMYCENDVSGATGDMKFLSLGVRAAVYETSTGMFRAFWLPPRSSISKTPLRMANSIGVIDAGYRGILMGAVDFKQDYSVKTGDRYFQLVGPDMRPWSAIHIVDQLPGGETLRGEGGFGSTGKTM